MDSSVSLDDNSMLNPNYPESFMFGSESEIDAADVVLVCTDSLTARSQDLTKKPIVGVITLNQRGISNSGVDNFRTEEAWNSWAWNS